VSIAAGVSTADLEEAGGEALRVVRAMPNTPCLVQEGMTVVCGGSRSSVDDLSTAESLFRPLGRVRRLDEEHMDAVTGLSGSGPAFLYVIIEALSEGGVMTGLPRDVATEMAAQTVRGAASMVLETGRHPAALKDDVTTPAGCTISALLSLEDGRLRSVLARGVQEAARAAAGLGESVD
ncbi:MAG TPA: pyrroline-5-carboxylate reductase, partial [Deltaproteobacteria bacterium]|nr:pyrroline-5-carboxylate reductase [Deltaproteobacteria bacterium]